MLGGESAWEIGVSYVLVSLFGIKDGDDVCFVFGNEFNVDFLMVESVFVVLLLLDDWEVVVV